ncbi:hypothetical protein GOODEAATRI_003965 [Goodea atripinnis]|uniref:Uncharacterized protein n=1 Tax=Goodea atripinnis TaxID=208336 RepID=A0ABV0NRL2_9TELE
MRPGITLKLAGWAKPVSSHGSTVTRQRHGLNDGEPGGGLSLETIAEIKTPDRGRPGSVAFCATAILKASTSFFPFVETHCGILIGVDKSASLLYLPPPPPPLPPPLPPPPSLPLCTEPGNRRGVLLYPAGSYPVYGCRCASPPSSSSSGRCSFYFAAVTL